MFHPQWREQALAGLGEPFDLVILGGGITGCGIFFDAAQRGLRVILVERGDLASGTSSRSSKLIHGGLRYLKQMQFSVTRASCRERDRLVALNPHLVTLQRWIYPSYEDDRTPGWQVSLGLSVYDRLTRGPARHTRLDPPELERLAPDLGRDKLERALSYFDARVDDARLTLAVAATGAAYGGSVLTRAEAVSAMDGPDGQLRGVVVRDALTGRSHEVEAALTVNAAGVWVDRVRHLLGREGRRLRPSRGSHLIFRRERLPLEAAVTVLSPDDRRPVFFIPHPEGTLVGTTDIFHDGALDDPRPTEEEVGYLLRAASAGFLDHAPTRADVVACFAGLRPVLAHHLDDPSKASREEAIWHEDGLLSVAGGKLTTWRATAEEAVDEALDLLPAERARRAAPCATAGTPLAGLAPADLDRRLAAAADGLDPAVAAGMARRLGSLAWTACALADGRRDLRSVVDGSDLCVAEVKAHLRFSGVVHLEDLFLRRVRAGMWRPDEVESLLVYLRRPIRRELGWGWRRWEAEIERYAAAAEGWTVGGIVQGDVAGETSGTSLARSRETPGTSSEGTSSEAVAGETSGTSLARSRETPRETPGTSSEAARETSARETSGTSPEGTSLEARETSGTSSGTSSKRTSSKVTSSSGTAAEEVVVLVNPAAGGGRAGRVWERLKAGVPELAGAREIRAADAEAGRAELAAHLAKGCRRVLAVGGDGTAQLVANVLLETGRAASVPFGLIPAGTGSDLARTLGLPRDPARCARRLLAADPHPIDALRLDVEGGESRYAVNTISAGLSGAVVPAVNANPDRGRLTYLACSVKALLRYRGVPCRLEVDGEPFSDDPFFLVAMANGRFFGKGMQVAPDAELDDGLIDVVLVPPVPLWQLPYRMPQFLTGRHVRLSIVKTSKARSVRLEPPPGFLPYEVDGEVVPSGPAEVRVLPGALQILA